MPKTTYTVPEVPGSKRTSERPYTHAVIGRRDPRMSAIHRAADLARSEAKYKKWDGKHWDDYQRASVAVVGQQYLNHNNFWVEARDYNVELGQKFIEANPTRQGYIDSKSAERFAAVEAMKAGTPGDLHVLQWSMSLQNAMKAVGTHTKHNSDVRVVECVPVAKKARS